MDTIVVILLKVVIWGLLIALVLRLLWVGWKYVYRRRADSRPRPRSEDARVTFVPKVPVVDIDHSPWFSMSDDVIDGESRPVYLALDTETLDAIPKDLMDSPPSPAIALSWALLDERGYCLREHSYVLRRLGVMSTEAIALHGVSQTAMEAGDDPEQVYRMLLLDVQEVQWLVAHNLSFHLGVAIQDLELLGLDATPLTRLTPLCTMKVGRSMAIKYTRPSGEASFPSLGELFAYLYFGRLEVGYTYRSKSLRDLRLLTASLRQLIARRLIGA